MFIMCVKQMKREDEPKITYSKSICYKIPTLALSRSGTESKKDSWVSSQPV